MSAETYYNVWVWPLANICKVRVKAVTQGEAMDLAVEQELEDGRQVVVVSVEREDE